MFFFPIKIKPKRSQTATRGYKSCEGGSLVEVDPEHGHEVDVSACEVSVAVLDAVLKKEKYK